MPKNKQDTNAWKYSRRNIGVDHNLTRAQSTLYELYYLYLREHPEIAPLLANLLLHIEISRAMLRDFHVLCWETLPDNFDDIGGMASLLNEAYRDVMERTPRCQGYLSDLEAGARELFKLQSRLDGRLPKLSDLLSHSPRKSRPPP